MISTANSRISGFANMADYWTVGSDGLPRLDFSALSRNQSTAIAELTIDIIRRKGAPKDEALVERVRLRVHNKMVALE